MTIDEFIEVFCGPYRTISETLDDCDIDSLHELEKAMQFEIDHEHITDCDKNFQSVKIEGMDVGLAAQTMWNRKESE